MGVRVNQQMFRRHQEDVKRRKEHRGDFPEYPREEDRLVLRDRERMFVRPFAGEYGEDR